jgi:FKBP-type peptidyl-prolyl cis-trans isomerase 2
MRITKNSVIRISYRVQDPQGEVIDESPATDPFEFYCGTGQLVPGFERALMGLRAGEHKEFIVPAVDAYGERNDSLVKNVPRTSLPAHITVRRGMRIPMRSPEGVELVCRILDVGNDRVVADFNHPLAGQPLRCVVNVLDVRSAN